MKTVKWFSFLFAVLTALLLVACSDSATVQETSTDHEQTEPVPDTALPEQSEPEPAQSEPSISQTETQEAQTEASEVISLTVSFTGDCTFGRNQKAGYYGSFDWTYDQYGENYFFKNVLDIFQADDLTVINLEGPLTTSSDIQDKTWNHKGDPKYVGIMTSSSIEVATMGNNHRLDYGESGCDETVSVLQNAGVAYCYNTNYAICEVKGVKIGFVSVSQGYFNEKWLWDGHDYLREQGCAFVVACVHWGGDKTSELLSYQKYLGHKLIDNGYDLVIGNHPHVLQSIEIYNGRFIAYSLGNFCYGGSYNPRDKDSGIFQKTFTVVDGVPVIDLEGQFIPCSISTITTKNDFCPTPSVGEEYDRILAKINEYNLRDWGYTLDENGRVREEDFLRSEE